MPWEKVKVLGVKGFRDQIDGDAIDSGKVFIEEALDDTRNNERQFAVGVASVAYSLGSFEAAQELLGIGLEKGAVLCELDFKRVTNGKTSRTVVVGVRLPVAKVAA